MTDLHYLPATQALQEFRTRELSPVELVTAVIERAEAVEPVINAFAETFFDQALEQARAAEARYGGKGGAPRPLEGLPVPESVRAKMRYTGYLKRSVPAPALSATDTPAPFDEPYLLVTPGGGGVFPLRSWRSAPPSAG